MHTAAPPPRPTHRRFRTDRPRRGGEGRASSCRSCCRVLAAAHSSWPPVGGRSTVRRRVHTPLCTPAVAAAPAFARNFRVFHTVLEESLVSPDLCCGGQADEEPVDPKPILEKQCHSSCTTPWTAYQKCETRIKEKGFGDCEAWYFDYWKCVDKCVRSCPLAAVWVFLFG